MTYPIVHTWRTPLFQQILGAEGFDFDYQEVDNAVSYAVQHVRIDTGETLDSADDYAWATKLEEHALRYLDVDYDELYEVLDF